MAVNMNMMINAGMRDNEQQTGKFGAVSVSGKKQEVGKEDNRSLMLNGQFDPIEQKKALAKKQAYKIVKDALARELKMDGNMDEVRAHTEELSADLAQAQNKISEINAEKEKWREESGVAADSEEQKDLELLEKREAYAGGDLSKALSEEEMERLAEIDKRGYTEYEQRALSLERSKAPYQDIVRKAESGIISDNAVIRGTRLERLKKDPIRKAQNEAQDLLAAASREVMGMLVGEAKEYMDEKSEELQEKAEERAEKKEEQEEKLEATKEKREELEALADPQKETGNASEVQTQAISKDPVTEAMVQLDAQKEDYQQEIEEKKKKMNLIAEDIKGIKVDEIF